MDAQQLQRFGEQTGIEKLNQKKCDLLMDMKDHYEDRERMWHRIGDFVEQVDEMIEKFQELYQESDGIFDEMSRRSTQVGRLYKTITVLEKIVSDCHKCGNEYNEIDTPYIGDAEIVFED